MVASAKVLICDDSRSYAAALRRVLEHDGEITVAAVCESAEDTIAVLPRVAPDLVTMDIELPGMDGLQAVEHIMSSRPTPILVLSSHVGRGSDRAAAALAAGALDAVAKDDLDLRDPAGPAAEAVRRRVALLSRARVIRHPRGRVRLGDADPHQGRPATVIGICASTGGPQVLGRIFGLLPPGYPIPLLVVQHVASGFTSGLAQWLDRTVPPPVRVAADGAPAKAGVWLAPEGAHLRVTAQGLLVLDRRTVSGFHRPSGDVLLESVAGAAGRTGVAVVLTGMGSDGVAGALAVRARGGLAMAQDEASSAVYGMPHVAAERGIDLVLSPDRIAATLLRLRQQPFRETP